MNVKNVPQPCSELDHWATKSACFQPAVMLSIPQPHHNQHELPVPASRFPSRHGPCLQLTWPIGAAEPWRGTGTNEGGDDGQCCSLDSPITATGVKQPPFSFPGVTSAATCQAHKHKLGAKSWEKVSIPDQMVSVIQPQTNVPHTVRPCGHAKHIQPLAVLP